MLQILTAVLGLLVSISAIAGVPGAAFAQKRVALVIGNSAYQHAPQLANPKQDAMDMANVLKKHDFEVVEGFDLDKAAFDRKVRDFSAALKGAEAGLFFYAGHGLQVGGQNYLVPIDAKAETEDALDWEMLRVDVVHRAMERSTNTNILFLDACRDNPLARNLARAMGTRSSHVGRGLATIEGGVGTLISFSTQPGNVALDGAGRNSPFASALVKQLSVSTDDLSAMLIAVRNDVMQQTQRKQIPWEHSALTGRFFFNSRAKPAATSLPAKSDPSTSERPTGDGLSTGVRPPKFSGVTAGGLFTEAHAEGLRMLAEKHQLPLPIFQIEVPDADVPAPLRRFVGVWIDLTGVPNGARVRMIIATRVSKDGKLDGYWTYGPPGTSRYKQPASMFQIAGTITGNTLRYNNPTGNASYQLTLSNSGKMNYVFSSTTGEAGATEFDPVWTLVQAEKSAKK